MPIVSTYVKYEGSLGYPPPYRGMFSTRQKRPYVRARFYKTFASWACVWKDGSSGIGERNIAYGKATRLHESDQGIAVRAAAYSRLMGKALPQAAMLVNMAQGKQSWEMIATRTMQLVRAFKHLRRGNLGGFAAELSLDSNVVRRRMTRKRAIQNPSGAWLEFTFGWSPLIGDIYNAVDVLQTAFPTVPIRGSATDSRSTTQVFRPNWYRLTTAKAQCRLVADLVVTNPNLLLANQLGLLNPAAVVWDLVPFSFVVDWFLPVGKFIRTFNDQAGLELQGQCTTFKAWVAQNDVWNGEPGEHFASSVDRFIGTFVKPGFPTTLKLPTGSMWLAATSVALAVQVFGGKK